MDGIGNIVLIALLGAGAAYGLRHKGEPRPALTSGKKKLLWFLAGVLVVCILLLLAVALISANHPSNP